jgi:hypothetical protein
VTGTESWHLDFAADDGLAGFLRLELRRDEGVAWYWTYLVGPALDGLVVVRDHEVPLPRQGLEVRAEGLWSEWWCGTPGEHWTVGLEAFGVRLDDAEDALHGEFGERIPVGADLEWEVTEAGGTLHGVVLIGRDRYAVDGAPGSFTHTIGDTDWDAAVEPCAGSVVARALVPLPNDRVLERVLCRTDPEIRWSTTSIRG